MRVSRRALMAVARADAAAADHATGRWVATANATVARLTGLCERTVQYARATLVHLGLCRVVSPPTSGARLLAPMAAARCAPPPPASSPCPAQSFAPYPEGVTTTGKLSS